MNPIYLLSLVLAIVSGTFVALQTPTNALLARGLASPVNAAFVSFAVGTAALAIAALALGVRPAPSAMKALPWYAWTGGFYGAFFVAAAAFAAPRIGLTFYLTILIAGQVAMAMILDHYGAFGFAKQEVNVTRIAGALLVVGGVLLVRKG
jgi:transporter family-2 protein